MIVTIYRQPPLKYRTKYHILLVVWGHVPLVYVQGRRAFQNTAAFVPLRVFYLWVWSVNVRRMISENAFKAK